MRLTARPGVTFLLKREALLTSNYSLQDERLQDNSRSPLRACRAKATGIRVVTDIPVGMKMKQIFLFTYAREARPLLKVYLDIPK